MPILESKELHSGNFSFGICVLVRMAASQSKSKMKGDFGVREPSLGSVV